MHSAVQNVPVPQMGQMGLDALHRRQRARHLPDLTLSDALDAITSRWPIVAGIALLFALLGFAGTLVFPAGYKTSGFLVVDARRSSAPELGVITLQPGDPRIARSEAKVLTATEFLSALSDRLHLDQVPFITENADEMAKSDEGLPNVDPMTRLAAAKRDCAIDWLSRKLDVKGDDRSYAIEVSVTTPDPALSAKIVNEAMALYLERRNRDDAAMVDGASKAVGERYDQILGEVRGLESQLLEAHNVKGLVGTKAGRIDALDLTKLVDEQRDNEKQLANLTQSLSLVRHADETKNWQEIDTTYASPYLMKLLEQETLVARARADAASNFGANHPDMVRMNDELAAVHSRIHVEVSRIALTLSSQMEALKERQAEIASQVEVRTESSAQVEAADERIRQLEEELKGKQLLLSAYETRRQQLASTIGVGAGSVRIGAYATEPLKPAGPHPILLVILSGFVGGLLGLAYIVIERRFSDRMESADDLVAVIGLPVLGTVPEIRRRKKAVSPRNIWARCLNNPRGPLSESIRTLAMRIDFALKMPQATLLVTSAHPDEGKTSLAFSLAQFASLNGKRVLLVDGDLVRAGVSRAAAIAPNPRLESSEVEIHRDPHTGLEVLPAPRNLLPQHQGLALANLASVIAELRPQYDLVVIDTPPVMHVSDATLLAPQADAILFVSSLRHVKRSSLIEALERVEAAGSPILGIALSRVKPRNRKDYERRYDMARSLATDPFAPLNYSFSSKSRPRAQTLN